MKYFIEIELSNDVFEENVEELQKIIKKCAERISLFSSQYDNAIYPIYNMNGNRVGYHGYKNKD